MHHKIKESLAKAKVVGVITFNTLDQQVITCRRSEIEKLEYIDDGKNSHIAKIGGKLYRVKYAQLQKLRVFLASKEVPIRCKVGEFLED